jgi:lipid-binding SYLF domain-containing protein
MKIKLIVITIIIIMTGFWYTQYLNNNLENDDLLNTADKVNIDTKVSRALTNLYNTSKAASLLAPNAKAILVFPDIIKGGFIIGGQYGKGALQVNNTTTSYYNLISASYGLQAGFQTLGYALFLMTDDAVSYINQTDGWEIGADPNIVIIDQGLADSLSTTSLNKDIYVFFFDQKGFMAGVSIQGTKITKINTQ